MVTGFALLSGCTGVPANGAPASSVPAPRAATATTRATTTGSPTAPTPSAATSSPTATAKLALAGRTIVIDPGHNGVWTRKLLRKVPSGNGRTKACNSSGTASNAGYSEHAYNWSQANALAKELRSRGAKVRFTRTDDKGSGPCVNLRSKLANELQADALISIHADGSLGRNDRGFHVIVSSSMVGGAKMESASTNLAKAIRTELEGQTSMPRSTYIGKGTGLSFRNDLGTLNLSKRTAVMLEMGNMRNPSDARLLASASFRAQAASAIADGITATLK